MPGLSPVRAAMPLLLGAGLLPGQAPHAQTPWSFSPWQIAAPPQTGDPAWDGHPVDRFVRAHQAQAGITPSEVADMPVLLRRASFALLGLPPTPEQRARLAAQPTQQTFTALVEEMLTSSHYGERQARHWLDLARYSDSNGLDENLAFAQAYRYRDWVVAAHNADLPFDTFGRMQIAGDLLAEDPAIGVDGYVATGFLALGPRMLAEQDKEKLVLDTIDEQIDLVGRTFLGLTLGCARCHDHKFDPVSAADYYALAGIFKSTRSFRELGHVSQWMDRELATQAQIDARNQALALAATAKQDYERAATARADAQRRALVTDAGRYLLAGSRLLAQSVFLQAEASPRTSLHADHTTWGSAECGVLHTISAGEQFAEWDLQVERGGRRVLEVRYAAQESRPMRVLVDGQLVADQALTDVSGGWLPADQEWFVAAEFELGAGPHVLRLEGVGPHVPHLDALLLSPADTGQALSGGELQGLLPPVVRRAASTLASRASTPLVALWNELAALPEAQLRARCADRTAKGGLDAILLGALPPESVRDLAARYQTLFATAAAAAEQAAKDEHGAPLPLPIASLEQARALLFDRGGMLALPPAALRAFLPATALAELNGLQAASDRAAAAVPPASPVAMCVLDGEPVDVPIHLRGNHLTLAAEKTPRGVIAALENLCPAPAMPADASGRRQLADWLFDPRLPLAARVQVNRIWQRAFGQGLVRTPSNFGMRGDPPLHQDLLDWLARDFIAHGWSQKHVWRRILSSRTWQQASDLRADAGAIDPDNRLWWRNDRRRLDAESVRDAILFTTGALDPTLGGSLLTTNDRDYVTNDQSNDRARYDAPRRSLYLPIIRNAMYDMFTAFDYVDPSVHLECRPTSAVATQALFLLNGPFVNRQCEVLGARVQAEGPADDAGRVVWLWQTVLGRAPSDLEQRRARGWLDTARASRAPQAAWPGLCQVLFASSEFLYVD